MKHLSIILLLALGMSISCSSRLQSDSPKRDSTGAGTSGSDGYKADNKDTPAAPAKSFDQGTGTNTGDAKDKQRPDTETSTPGTDKYGKGPSNGQSNETVPPKK